MRQHIGMLNKGQGRDGDITSTIVCQFRDCGDEDDLQKHIVPTDMRMTASEIK